MPRPRQPLVIAQLKGTRKSRLNLNEPKFKGTPKCPKWLPKEAKAEWKRAYAILEPYGILKATDQTIFAAYCMSYCRWQQAERQVEKEGQTVREPVLTRSGNPTGEYKVKAHPAVAIARMERQSVKQIAALIGLDPSSRTRIAGDVPESDPLQEWLDAVSHDDDMLTTSPTN